jgi:hypothetical protein
MRKKSILRVGSRCACIFLASSLLPAFSGESWAATITVHFDKDVYVVAGPGEQFDALLLIDADPAREEDQPIPGGLYSYSAKTTFDPAKADVGSAADVTVPSEMDFFGLAGPAFLQVDSGLVGVKANVDEFNNPLLGYHGTLLATVRFTNLAIGPDSYPLDLDFFQTVGGNEQHFIDIEGTLLDPEIMFVPSLVVVIPEPATATLVGVMWILFLLSGLILRPADRTGRIGWARVPVIQPRSKQRWPAGHKQEV